MRTYAAFAVLLTWAPLGCHGHRAATDAGIADAGVEAQADAAREAATISPEPPDDAIAPTSSDELTLRARHLVEAIANDDATLASDILFPQNAWGAAMTTREGDDPEKQWEKRVARPFQRKIHALWRHHKGASRAQFVTLDVGHAMSQAIPPKRGWKKPLWTVTGSRLTFVVDGRTRTIAVHEMTAWRGAWYVTRL